MMLWHQKNCMNGWEKGIGCDWKVEKRKEKEVRKAEKKKEGQSVWEPWRRFVSLRRRRLRRRGGGRERIDPVMPRGYVAGFVWPLAISVVWKQKSHMRNKTSRGERYMISCSISNVVFGLCQFGSTKTSLELFLEMGSRLLYCFAKRGTSRRSFKITRCYQSEFSFVFSFSQEFSSLIQKLLEGGQSDITTRLHFDNRMDTVSTLSPSQKTPSSWPPRPDSTGLRQTCVAGRVVSLPAWTLPAIIGHHCRLGRDVILITLDAFVVDLTSCGCCVWFWERMDV